MDHRCTVDIWEGIPSMDWIDLILWIEIISLNEFGGEAPSRDECHMTCCMGQMQSRIISIVLSC